MNKWYDAFRSFLTGTIIIAISGKLFYWVLAPLLLILLTNVTGVVAGTVLLIIAMIIVAGVGSMLIYRHYDTRDWYGTGKKKMYSEERNFLITLITCVLISPFAATVFVKNRPHKPFTIHQKLFLGGSILINSILWVIVLRKAETLFINAKPFFTQLFY